MRTVTVLGLAILALAGCGGGNGRKSPAQPSVVPGAPFRFFNAFSSPKEVVVLANDQPLVDVDGDAAAGRGETLRFASAPSPSADLTLRSQAGGAFRARRTVPEFESGTPYTLVGFGEPGAEKTLVMNDDGITDSSGHAVSLRIIDLLRDPGSRFITVALNGEGLLFGTSENPTEEEVHGFFGLGRVSGTYTFTIHETSASESRVLATIPVPIDDAAPVTLLLYGSKDDVRYAFLRGRYRNLNP